MTDFMFAYATNIDAEEMHKHCPNAIFRGSGVLEGFKLVFSGYTGHAIATLKKQKGSSVNVIAWEMSPEDYYTIDNYEKFPYLYHKEKVSVVIWNFVSKFDASSPNAVKNKYGHNSKKR